ncbi:hypothetical protein EK468_24820 [Citrobacter braakii]|nr:hypothetical protein [Citrobacter braakii]
MHYLYLTPPMHWITTISMVRRFLQRNVSHLKGGKVHCLPLLIRSLPEKIICHHWAMKGFVSDKRQIKKTGDLMSLLLMKMVPVLPNAIITGALISTFVLMTVLWDHGRYAQLAGRDYPMILRGSLILC